MTQLTFTPTELMAEHDYAKPQIVAGRRMHGGFLADGTVPAAPHRGARSGGGELDRRPARAGR